MNASKPRKQRGSKPKSSDRERKAIRRLERDDGLIPLFQRLVSARNLRHTYLKQPKRSYKGAMLTVRNWVSTFGVSSGLTGVGGASSAAQLIQNSATSVYAAVAFQLSDLPNTSSFSALFDQYKIERVKLHFRARNNAVFVANTASPNGGVPMGTVAVDRDDASAWTSATDGLQYDNAIQFNGEEDFEVELVPSITPSVFASGAFSGYGVRSPMWIDIANTSVPHYGVKLHIGPLSATVTSSWVWDVGAEYIVSFKNSR